MSSNKKTVGYGNIGQYNATLPTFNDGEEGGLQLDINGKQLVVVAASANASAGTSTFFNATQSNTVTAVKVSAGNLYSLRLYNPGAAAVFVQIFDLATGSVTLGTTVPKQSFFVPIGGTRDENFGPMSFGTAISIAATTTVNGLTAPATAIVVNAEYV